MRRWKMDSYDVINLIYTILVLLIILTAVVVIFVSIYRSISIGKGKVREITGTVSEKNIKRVHNSDLYLVYVDTDDGNLEVLQISDSLLAMRFNSSDVYGGIREGEKYTFKVRGDRVYPLSWYPNIYEYIKM